MGMKVLVVDDSAAMRKIIKHCLEMLGLAPEQFYQAEHGEAGMAVLEKNPVEYVFLDLNMPGMDGFEFIKRIHSHPEWSGLKLIVVSSETSQVRIQELEKQNIQFLHKPFTPEDMDAILKNLQKPIPATIPAAIPFPPANEESLQKVMREVFNVMTFSSMEIPLQENPGNSEVMRSQMSYFGPVSGNMCLRVPREIIPELARNMLGEADDYQVEEQEQLDVVGELLNVICGNLLNVQAGREQVFQLGVPETSWEVTAAAEAARPKIAHQQFRLWFAKGWAELTVETK